jgi:hypothetical protein
MDPEYTAVLLPGNVSIGIPPAVTGLAKSKFPQPTWRSQTHHFRRFRKRPQAAIAVLGPFPPPPWL